MSIELVDVDHLLNAVEIQEREAFLNRILFLFSKLYAREKITKIRLEEVLRLMNIRFL